MMKIIPREVNQEAYETLLAQGQLPMFARLYAARGISHEAQLDASLNSLLAPDLLTNNQAMARILADAIEQQKRILIIGDYDADGATATAVAYRGLTSMGAKVDYLIPNRFGFGYGLSTGIVQLAAQHQPDFILTVDNGIASVEGVALANALGISVLITDHHLPGQETPKATCIINPNQHGCNFPSKHLAGVGVMFYALLALRAELRERGVYQQQAEPNLSALLDLVALGTVADLVKLDDNNRRLVEQGLRRIRAGKGCLAIRALLRIAGRDVASCTAQDLAFSVAPRLNAAGRLDDMSVGVACLISEDEDKVNTLAAELHALNQARKSIESDMRDAADVVMQDMNVANRYSLSLYQAEWHQGVIGILASRIKEQYHRPTIAFASAGEGKLKGSGRSIAGLHLRDALDLVSKRAPNLILQFGGHAMAAGLSIMEYDFPMFCECFEQVASELLTPEALQAVIHVDGTLSDDEINLDTAIQLETIVWGQAFPAPCFFDSFEVVQQRILGERHLKLTLKKQHQSFEAIFFGQAQLLPKQVQLVYQLKVNEYQGNKSCQLQIMHADPVSH